MKKQVTPTKSVGISRGAVGKHYGVNGGSVSAWVKAGCPQLPNGLFVLTEVEAWLRKRDEKKAAGRDLKEEKLRQEIERIKRTIQSQDMDLEKQRGTVHDKAACAASLTAIRARESGILHGLSQRFAGAFPEAVQQAEWLDREVDEVIGRLNAGDTA
jgi:phage terminase Nu1 subunit (DNA packaging protein)